MNDIKAIPIEHIRPFTGQPRSWFDPQALKELADSIKTHGQSTPAWVVPVWAPEETCVEDEQQYELIAGERRWRACRLAGVPTLLCEVREGITPEQQYVASVMENFGRKDCTVMETARSVGNLLKQYDGDYARTAKVFARSEAWVRQLSILLRLDPMVAAMLEPPDVKLTTQVGVTLANLRPDVQVRLAREIAARGLKHKSALSLIRSSASNAERVVRRGARRRKPSDDFELLRRFLESLGPSAQAIIDLGDTRLKELFKHREPKLQSTVRAVLQKRIQQLQQLERLLG